MGRACRGEIGRLPSECCAFLAPLLDCGAIELVAKCFHCPLELHVADTILLSIDVSILPAVRFLPDHQHTACNAACNTVSARILPMIRKHP